MPFLAGIDYEIWSILLIGIHSMLVRVFQLMLLFPIAYAMQVHVLPNVLDSIEV